MGGRQDPSTKDIITLITCLFKAANRYLTPGRETVARCGERFRRGLWVIPEHMDGPLS